MEPESENTEQPKAAIEKSAGLVRRVLARTPRPLLALSLIGLLLVAKAICALWLPALDDSFTTIVFFLMPAAIFIVGALQRLNWRHAVIMLVVFLAIEGTYLISDQIGLLPSEGYYPFAWLIKATLFVWLLGIAEAKTTGYQSRAVYAWLFVAALFVAALHLTITRTIGWSDIRIPFPYRSEIEWWSLGFFMYWPLVALLAWLCIPLILRLDYRGRWSPAIAVGLVSVILSWYAVYFCQIVFAFAEQSLHQGKPFPKDMSVVLLAERGRASDFDLIISEFCGVDWPNQSAEYVYPDWCRTAVAVLSRNVEARDRAADASIVLLRKQRSSALAMYAAKLIASANKVEAAPILLRYSLRHGGPRSECSQALEKMGIPEVGVSLLVECLAWDRPGSRPEDFPIGKENRERLAALLKVDVGDAYSAWAEAVDEAIDRHHGTLPADVQNEIDREFLCFTKMGGVLERLQLARGELIRRRLAAKDQVDQLQVISDFQRKVGNRFVPDSELPPAVMAACLTIEAVKESVAKDLEISKPNYDVPTGELFEQEITAYAARVEEVILKHVGALPGPVDSKSPDRLPVPLL